MATTVATVPSAKRAVYHMTAERHAPRSTKRTVQKPAAPVKVADRQPVNCDPGLGGGGVPEVPLVTYASPIADEPTTGSLIAASGATPPLVGAIGVGGGGGGGGGTPVVTPPTSPVGPIPEPSVWLMMIAGVGTLGAALRRRRSNALPANRRSRRSMRKATLGGALWSGSAAVEAGDMAATVAVKSAVVSAAGKAMLCVCPAAIVAGSVMTVPPIRKAVHASTASSEPAPAFVYAPPRFLPPCEDSATIPIVASAFGFPASVDAVPTVMPVAAVARSDGPTPVVARES